MVIAFFLVHTNNGDYMKKITYYINAFLIYSIIGFIIETTLKTFFFKNMNNGIMYGPWIPVYGLGVVLIIFIMRLVFNRIKVKRGIKIFLVFLISMIVLTIIELLGGILIEEIFNKVFWDYSDLKFHLGHYIALEISLIWGIMSLVVIYLIKPIIDKIIKKIPSIITYLVLFIFIVDAIITFIVV